MKKIQLVILIVIIFTMCMFIAPSILNAAPLSYNGHYYSFASSDKSWTDARNEAETLTYKQDPNGPIYYGHLVSITSQGESDWINFYFKNLGGLWIGAYQTGSDEPSGGWQWVTGEEWSFTNWRPGEPNDSDGVEDYGELRSSNGGDWNDNNNDAVLSGYIVEYEIKPAAHAPYVEPVWIRDSEMKCKQVWINEGNMFQFSFIYPYADNNWVRIYDMSGNVVYEIDMPWDNPNIIVDLPDGMYTVKTFHDQIAPIQEFIIGKP
jgi:hypothetical protein